MNILLIGAGNIAHVYGFHFHNSGHEITFVARQKRRRSIDEGILLKNLKSSQRMNTPLEFKSYETYAIEDIHEKKWDVIIFCVPSDALNSDLLKRVGEVSGDSIIVKLQPGLFDKDLFSKHFTSNLLVDGMVSFIAFSKLNLDSGRVATHYWFPPLITNRFSGPRKAVEKIVSALNQAGIPSSADSNVNLLIGQIMAYEAPLLAGLEINQWSIRDFMKSDTLEISRKSILETINVVSHYHGVSRQFIFRLISKSMIRVLTSYISLITPFDLEEYLKLHFTKLSIQSRQYLGEIIDYAKKNHSKIENTEFLFRRMQEL